jgi:GNAT superfamily N-acetyltransferase
MALELVPTTPNQIPELGRICYDAFSTLQDRHGYPRDFPDVDTGRMIIAHVATRSDYTGVTAVLDGTVVGSNYLLHSDPVSGVGPITVDPKVQTRGIGRALMTWVMEEVRRRGIRQTRLFQEAINTTSLSLYASLGFAWRDSAALMRMKPAEADDPTIRPLTAEDLASVESLSERTYGFSRAGDGAELLKAKFPAFIREKQGKAVGYLISSLFGHAGAESNGDLLALVSHAARHVPSPLQVFICPLSNDSLYRSALGAGYRTLKVLSYMSLGKYVPPRGAFLPSIQC